ncbi:adenylate/guanylate cyclase domain-containing protein [Arenibacter sp. GZD96]|uniref:adenylate/guanylate cyclase domain-containing protein n=1 Tax=Aurantibrevibacter litoralis TaxID=3106030 RepID=UPI002AFFD4B9|nr:adenylate/guanylate cyclase domain-containing protein [Arenibacter sp. GZD-96]MEA1786041.1 adenylate/guanylate cyclase domain-containing protein [Arenibacter sp. GZD-96]
MVRKLKSTFKFWWFAWLCGAICVVQAQDGTIDSLKNLLKIQNKDTAYVNALNALSYHLSQNGNYSEGIDYANEALFLADRINFESGKALAFKNKGIGTYYKGDYLDVFENWTKSLETYEIMGDTLGIATLSSNLGVIYYDQGSHAKALDYYFKSLSFSKKVKDPILITSALLNIGGVYSQLKDYDKALASFHEIEEFLPLLDKPSLKAKYLIGLGEVYGHMGDHEKAKRYYKEALVINAGTPDYAHNLSMLGKEEFKQGNRVAAIEYLNKALETARNSELPLDQVQTLTVLGDVYQQTNQRKALKAYQEAEALALELKINEELRDIYQGMSLAFEALGDYRNAFRYQNKYIELKDLIFNLETDDKIRGLQFDFDLENKQDEIGLLQKEAEITELQAKRQTYIIYGTVLLLTLVLVLAIGSFSRYRFEKKTNQIIGEERRRSEDLLRNILPKEIATELKENGKVKAKKYDLVTVMFTDFKGFTLESQNLSPEILVKTVDYYFSKFDAIVEKYGLEKIKTIGDAYMCAGGLSADTQNHPFKMINAAFEILEVMKTARDNPQAEIMNFEIRIGINTGTVVAGVVGTKKFAYDIWGDAVNVAARMETMSEPGKVNISENTFQLVKHKFDCEFRGEVYVKNKGNMSMYFVNSVKDGSNTDPI